MCVASRKTGGKFTERFFSYPEGVESAIVFSKTKASIENVYFCPQLLTEKRRAKTNVDMVSSIWADLDDCPPNLLKVEPTLVLETSPHRYQAIWTLNNPIPGEDAEAASRRIAYGHAQDGSDRSGWDLTQLLRIPGTYNHKYDDSGIHKYQVTNIWMSSFQRSFLKKAKRSSSVTGSGSTAQPLQYSTGQRRGKIARRDCSVWRCTASKQTYL